MNAQDAEKIVDKLAEKIGVAVDKLQPVAEETIRQVQVQGLLRAGFGLLSAILVGVFVCWSFRTLGHWEKKLDETNRNDRETMEWIFVGRLVTLILATLCWSGCVFVGMYWGLSAYFAPIPTLFGLL